jgi:hypothetical protein
MLASEVIIFDYRSIESTNVVLYSSLGMIGLPGDIAAREREMSQLVVYLTRWILFARPITYNSTYYFYNPWLSSLFLHPYLKVCYGLCPDFEYASVLTLPDVNSISHFWWATRAEICCSLTAELPKKIFRYISTVSATDLHASCLIWGT